MELLERETLLKETKTCYSVIPTMSEEIGIFFKAHPTVSGEIPMELQATKM